MDITDIAAGVRLIAERDEARRELAAVNESFASVQAGFTEVARQRDAAVKALRDLNEMAERGELLMGSCNTQVKILTSSALHSIEGTEGTSDE